MDIDYAYTFIQSKRAPIVATSIYGVLRGGTPTNLLYTIASMRKIQIISAPGIKECSMFPDLCCVEKVSAQRQPDGALVLNVEFLGSIVPDALAQLRVPELTDEDGEVARTVYENVDNLIASIADKIALSLKNSVVIKIKAQCEPLYEFLNAHIADFARGVAREIVRRGPYSDCHKTQVDFGTIVNAIVKNKVSVKCIDDIPEYLVPVVEVTDNGFNVLLSDPKIGATIGEPVVVVEAAKTDEASEFKRIAMMADILTDINNFVNAYTDIVMEYLERVS